MEDRQRQTEADSEQREARLRDEIRRIENRNRAYAAGAAAAESARSWRDPPPDPAREAKVKSQNEKNNEAEVELRKLHPEIYKARLDTENGKLTPSMRAKYSKHAADNERQQECPHHSKHLNWGGN